MSRRTEADLEAALEADYEARGGALRICPTSDPRKCHLAPAEDEQSVSIAAVVRFIAEARAAQERAHRVAPKVPCAGCGVSIPDFRRVRVCGPLGTFEHAEVCLDCSAQREHDAQFRVALASIPRRFAWARFGASELPARCQNRAALAKARVSTAARSVVLLGAPGSGKTSLAAAMLRAVIDEARDRSAAARTHDRGRFARFVSAHDLAKARPEHGLGRGEAGIVQAAMRASVLVIDDLGSEQDGHASAVVDVVQVRHNEERPTWVTTWLTQEAAGYRYGSGVERRLFEAAKIITVESVSRE